MLKRISVAAVLALASSGVSPGAEAKAFDGVPVNRAAARVLRAAGAVSDENYRGFDQGFSLVRALYFVSEEAENHGYARAAGRQLRRLSESLAGTPEAARLEEVTEMYLAKKGSREERWRAIEGIIASVSERSEGERKWYFDAGVTLTKLSLFSFLQDEARLRDELDNTAGLVARMPEGVPAEMAAAMTDIAESAEAGDFGRIAGASEDAVASVLG